MRNYQLKKIVSLFVMLCSFTIRAQLPNGSFETNCGANNDQAGGTLCSTYVAGCIPGWFTTHGSPQLATSSGYDGAASVSMWSNNGVGEGIGVNLGSALVSGGQYMLCFAYRVNNPDGLSPSNIRVLLTNGKIHVAADGCGDPPLTSASQEVGSISITESTNGWVSGSVTFLPNASYGQILIYPFTNENLITAPVTILVDHFRLTRLCPSNLLIDHTSPSVSGTFDERFTIRAGSHVNGSSTTGYVTVDQPGLTTFAATQFVSLETNFIAIPGAVNEAFQAIIQPCRTSCQPIGSRENMTILPFPPNTDLENKESGIIHVFPNPASDQITVYSKQGLKSVVINDISGRTVMVFQPTEDETKQTFRLPDVKAGIYLLRLTDQTGRSETKKLVIE